jgi:hypothetical protein
MLTELSYLRIVGQGEDGKEEAGHLIGFQKGKGGDH